MIAQALVVPRHKTRPVVRMVTVMVGPTLVMISPTKEHSGQMQIAMDSATTREESTLIHVPQWWEPQAPTDMGVLIQTQIHGLIDPKFFHLDSEARRELVSHIRGEGVEVSDLLERSRNPNSTGWARRVSKGISSVVDKLDKINQGDVKLLNSVTANLQDMMDREGMKGLRGKSSIEKLAELMQDSSRRERVIDGRLTALNNHGLLFQNLIRSDTSVVLGNAGETDEVVTIDTRRQIRWPGSINL